jgi:hypothetical protein
MTATQLVYPIVELPRLTQEPLCLCVFVVGFAFDFATITRMEPQFYCPQCARPVSDPLTCGDCASIICRVCGTPLESSDELAIG